MTRSLRGEDCRGGENDQTRVTTSAPQTLKIAVKPGPVNGSSPISGREWAEVGRLVAYPACKGSLQPTRSWLPAALEPVYAQRVPGVNTLKLVLGERLDVIFARMAGVVFRGFIVV
jgi:hypothetical protein